MHVQLVLDPITVESIVTVGEAVALLEPAGAVDTGDPSDGPTGAVEPR